MLKKKIRLKNGEKIEGDFFEKEDLKKIKKIFLQWMDINKELEILGGRKVNVPDVFSEALYCIHFNAVRTNGIAHSYDAVDISTGEGIQVKSASIPNDCTSFGPKSTWDKLYFVDFAPNGKIDGNVFFYEIRSEKIYSLILNNKKNETFIEQQKQGRRPRFSIKSKIINECNLKPVKKINLYNID